MADALLSLTRGVGPPESEAIRTTTINSRHRLSDVRRARHPTDMYPLSDPAASVREEDEPSRSATHLLRKQRHGPVTALDPRFGLDVAAIEVRDAIPHVLATAETGPKFTGMAYTDEERRRIRRYLDELRVGIQAVLVAAGCSNLGGLDVAATCRAFANYRFRRLPVRTRSPHWSDTLQQRTDIAVDERAAIEAIAEKSRNGEDLYPHQSVLITNAKPRANDGLLAAWGIQHLHLGLPSGKPAKAPFVNRSRNIVLARVTDTDLYLLDLLPHGPQDDPPWWQIDVMDVLHRNWPEAIAYYRVDGYEGGRLTWQEYERMRPGHGKGCNFTFPIVAADGTAYLFDGIYVNGFAGRVGMEADRLMSDVRDLSLPPEREHQRLVVGGNHTLLDLRLEPRA